jgi:adenine-specific DNA-methyltransferase
MSSKSFIHKRKNMSKQFEIEKLQAEIDRLKKELKKRKKYGLVWEEKPEEVVEMCKEKLPVLKEIKNKEIITDKNKPVNLLIEGDNYHALSVLNYTHAKKVDVIYIDPPYNTGARDWKYNNDFIDINDAFRHSRWLSMMNNRLILAKNLLKPDGVLICAIDENEHAHLGVILEQLFPNKEIHSVVIVHNPRGVQGKNFSYCHDYAFFVFPSDGKIYIQNKQRENVLVEELRDHGGNSLRTDAKNCFYPFLCKNKKIVGIGNIPDNDVHPRLKNIKKKSGIIEVWPIDKNGVERKWVFAKHTVSSILDKLDVKEIATGEIDIFRTKDEQKYRTVWIDPKYDASTYGSKIVADILGNNIFPFPKSLYTVMDCIGAVIGNRKQAIVLDFFAGSGTTGHAALELNKEDGGNRKFILCTNDQEIDNNGGIKKHKICTDICYPRIKKVIEGYKNLKGEKVEGLGGNLKYFKTNFVGYDESTDRNKIKLTVEATEMLCVKEGTFEKILDQKNFKIFRNINHYTGIIFDQAAIPAFKKTIKNIKGKFSVYIFSLGDEDFSEEFADLNEKRSEAKSRTERSSGARIQLSPIPEAILRVYRRIFK